MKALHGDPRRLCAYPLERAAAIEDLAIAHDALAALRPRSKACAARRSFVERQPTAPSCVKW